MSEHEGLRDRKKRQTTDHLAQTAMELFRARGYDVVTMEEIAETAQVSRRTLYAYFPMKEALLGHFFSERVAEDTRPVLEQLQSLPDALDRLHIFLLGAAWWAEPYKACYGPFLQYRFHHPESPDCGGSPGFIRLIADAQAAGQLRRDRTPERLKEDLYALMAMGALRWLAGQGSLEDNYRQVWDFFLNGASTRQGGARAQNPDHA